MYIYIEIFARGLDLEAARAGLRNGRVVPSTLAFYHSFHSSIVPTLAFYDSFHSSIVPTLAFHDSFHSSIVPTLAFYDRFHFSIVPTLAFYDYDRTRVNLRPCPLK